MKDMLWVPTKPVFWQSAWNVTKRHLAHLENLRGTGKPPMSGKVSRLPGRLQPDDMHPLRSWPISMSHRMQRIAKEESNKLKELESQEKSTPTMQQKSSCPTRSTKSREMACVFESIKIIPKQLKGTFHCVQSQCGQLTLSVSKTADSLNGGRTPLDLHC